MSTAPPTAAMWTWPPDVKVNNTRNPEMANPRLVNQQNLNVTDLLRFKNHLDTNDPNKEPPKLELYKTAAKPILYWRSAELPAQRPADYDQIGRDLKKIENDIA